MTRIPMLLAGACLLLVASTMNAQPGVKYKTPEEVFEASKTAAKKGDFKAMVQMLAPESISEATEALTFVCVFLSSLPEGVKIDEKSKPFLDAGAKHGLTKEAIKKELPADPLKASKEDQEKAIKKLAATVKDNAGFLADVMAAMPEKEQANVKEVAGSSTLKNVKVEGDKASGTVAMKRDGKDVEEPIVFRKVDDSWRIVKDMKK